MDNELAHAIGAAAAAGNRATSAKAKKDKSPVEMAANIIEYANRAKAVPQHGNSGAVRPETEAKLAKLN